MVVVLFLGLLWLSENGLKKSAILNIKHQTVLNLQNIIFPEKKNFLFLDRKNYTSLMLDRNKLSTAIPARFTSVHLLYLRFLIHEVYITLVKYHP